MQEEYCDVFIIGGGPAGSTAAALLAQHGRDVVMVEKMQHPRFHIGESLLPRNLAVFDRLGVREQVAAMGIYKPGAEFISDETGASVSFNFAFGIDQDYTHSYQVPRAEFDAMLFDNATRRGARTAMSTSVTNVAMGRDGERAVVTVIGPDKQPKQFAPRYLLDASGRETFLAGRMGLKKVNKRNNTAAVYAHFRGAEQRDGEMQGFISIHLTADGWFWLIPLPDDITSVGFVGTQAAFKNAGRDMRAFFLDRIQSSPTVSSRMSGAELATGVSATGNYSYSASSWGGDGYLMIGDAFAFIDPVFSSGVLLAMAAGEMAADIAGTWIDDRRLGLRMARDCERKQKRLIDALSWLIYRINTPELRSMFMNPNNKFRMRDGLVSVLAGNVEVLGQNQLPLIAFKAIYYVAAALRHCGLNLPEDGRIAISLKTV